MKLAVNRLVIFWAAGMLLLAGCGRDLEGDTITSDNTLGKVVYGTVISVREVTVKDTDRAKENRLGGLAGGAVGGLGGSAVGGGTGNDLAVAGGVIAGALIGAMIEEELSTVSAYEYIVQLDARKAPELVSKRQVRKRITTSGGVANEIKDSVITSETASEAISVVQQDDEAIQPGVRVLVVHRDDRTRLIPAPPSHQGQ